MWPHNYAPVLNSLGWSTLAAAVPIFVLLLLIGVLRKPAWIAGLSGLAAGLVVAIGVYGMPVKLAASSTLMGAAFGLLPIAWIVYWAVVLYRLTLETGNFEVIKDSIGGLTADRRLQAMLIAFAFGAFIEGAAGFGTPVAVAAAMLTGLGFSPFFAAGICLLANTAPVAFGSIGIPVVTLAGTTGIDEHLLSAWVGRLCAPVSLFIPAYLILVMGGFKGLEGRAAGGDRLRRLLRERAVPRLELRRAAARRHHGLDHGDRRPRRAVQGLAAEGSVRACRGAPVRR